MTLTRDGVVEAYRVTHGPGRGPRFRVGLYNWSDRAQTVTVPLTELGIDASKKWNVTAVGRSRGIGLREGALEFEA